MADLDKEVESEIKYHYDLIRDNEEKIVDKLNLNLGFFTVRPLKKVSGVEIIYDTPNDLLSSAGVVLSKQFNQDGIFFKVRKISHLPSEMKRPSKKVAIAECGPREAPKDFALQVAEAINNSFSNIFTIDLADVVKKTVPKIEIIIKGNLYEIISGTGFKGTMLFEKVTYRDMNSRKKVKRDGVTVNLPGDSIYEKDRADFLEGIERFCKGLIPYRESRFEIASRVLFPKNPQKRFGIKTLKGKKKPEENKEE